MSKLKGILRLPSSLLKLQVRPKSSQNHEIQRKVSFMPILTPQRPIKILFNLADNLGHNFNYSKIHAKKVKMSEFLDIYNKE